HDLPPAFRHAPASHCAMTGQGPLVRPHSIRPKHGQRHMSTITPCLWFNNNLEEAMEYYASIFPQTKLLGTTRYTEGGMGEPGTVMTGDFELLGQRFTAINGGPAFIFSEAVSFVIDCKD